VVVDAVELLNEEIRVRVMVIEVSVRGRNEKCCTVIVLGPIAKLDLLR
jgi:hypothetical protein